MGDTKTYLTGGYDADGNQLDSYDLTMGRLETRQKVTHHDAVEGVEEQVKALQKAQNEGEKEIVRLETELKKK